MLTQETLLLPPALQLPELEKFTNLHPLHWAAYYGMESIAEVLLKHGADIDAKNSDDLTPLHMAVIMCKSRMVKFLLDKGAKVDEIDKFGCTPLAIAKERQNQEIVELLIKRGANNKLEKPDIYIKTISGKSICNECNFHEKGCFGRVAGLESVMKPEYTFHVIEAPNGIQYETLELRQSMYGSGEIGDSYSDLNLCIKYRLNIGESVAPGRYMFNVHYDFYLTGGNVPINSMEVRCIVDVTSR